MDAGNSGPDPSNFAPEPSFVDSGVDTGYVDAGNADTGNFAPEPSMDVTGTVDAGAGVQDSGGGGGRERRNNRD